MHLLSIPAIILLVVAGLLIVPFNLSLNLGNEGFCIFGSYRLKFLGFTIRKAELLRPEKVKDKRDTNSRVDIGGEAVDEDEAPEPDNIRFQEDPRMLIDTVPAFYRFLRNMIRSIDIEQLSCNISFGFNDPSETAVISGYLWALIAMLPTHRTYIQIYPFFEGEKLDGCLNIEVSARLLWVLIASIKALMEKSIRSLLTKILRKKMPTNLPPIKSPITDIKKKCNGNGTKF